jgi:DNA relaxase NicK
VLFWTGSKPRAECLLSINGDALGLIPQAEQLAFLRRFEDMQAKCTRVDVALDDYSRQRLDLAAIAAAAEAGNFAQFRRFKVTAEKQRSQGQVIATGNSIEFGRRGKDGSGVSLLMYDKRLESKGETDSIRFEVRFAKERAEMLGMCLFSSHTEEALVEKLRNAVGGAIDFIDRSAGDANLSRCPRLGWWQQLLDVLGRVRHVVKRPVAPLQQFVEWFKRSVAGQLSIVRGMFNSAGQDFDHFMTTALNAAEPRAFRHVGKRALGLDFRACYSP